MKRQTRLTITGETIRRLDVTALREVIGGAPQCSLANKDSCYPDPPPRAHDVVGGLRPSANITACHCPTFNSCP